MNRRDFVAGSVFTAGIAGCLSESSEGYIQPDGDPPVISDALDCTDDEFTRFQQKYGEEGPEWGADGHFELRIMKRSYNYGDTAEIVLRNRSSDGAEINDYRWFNFELYTEAGWQDVRGTTADEPFAYPDDGHTHEPDAEFEWTIELTEAGVSDASFWPEGTTVCPALQSGRYRFVFSNQFGEEEDVAVAFDLHRDG